MYFVKQRLNIALAVACLLGCGVFANAAEPPTIPVGYDAYLQWDKMPQQRIGTRAYMRSTYDRRGNNESADASHFLYQEREDFNVTLDVEGTGILYFARYNHWHGSPWHYEIDGQNNIVKETTTANPLKKLKDSVFIPEAQFPSPLTFTYATTKGADLMWVPLGFEDRFRMAYSRTFYGTGYYIYHLFSPSAKLSQPVQSWSASDTPPQDVLDLLNSSGSDIAPTGAGVTQQDVSLALGKGETKQVASLEGSHTVRALKLSVPAGDAVNYDDVRLRITWDGRDAASVDAPLSLFFGAGTFYNPAGSEYLVKALPVNIRFADGRMHLDCYFPMPFFKSAKIELVNPTGSDLSDIQVELRTEEYDGPPHEVSYFHATYADHANPELGKDLVFLDTNKVEGGGPWAGNFVGTSFIFSERGQLRTLEGDPRFFFDDSETPQAYGTGTEEWGGGGDYWGGKVMTLPLAGHPVGKAARPASDRTSKLATTKGMIESAYRYLVADLMPFGKRAVIQFEHGAINNHPEHYQSVTYWYGAPFATLELTDTFNVGDPASEKAHAYTSPDASEPYVIDSRYEIGPDRVPADEQKAIANPKTYVDFEFNADADKTYYIWLRGRSSGSIMTDATWFQFDQDVGADRGFEAAGDKGFGNWRDNTPAGKWAWSSSLPQRKPETIKFKRGGKHRLRIQRRHGGHDIDQIWLSASQSKRPAADFRAEASENSNDEIVLTASDAAAVTGSIAVKKADGQKILHVSRQDAKSDWIEIFPSQKKTGRKTTTKSEFEVAVNKDNWGVVLRRTLDYQFPNQRGKVFVATGPKDNPEWKSAGVWYLAGSNTCYYSYPSRSEGELGKTNPIVQTSNRRFRDDEFLISADLTRGREKIRVKVEFTPVNIPLLPGREVGEQAWSEIEYKAYSYVLPEWKP